MPDLAPSGKTQFPLCSTSVAGRQRAIGVVAAVSINPPSTTPMVRRWGAGTPRVTAPQKAGG